MDDDESSQSSNDVDRYSVHSHAYIMQRKARCFLASFPSEAQAHTPLLTEYICSVEADTEDFLSEGHPLPETAQLLQ